MAKDSVFRKFLSKNSITPVNYLPLVHGSEAYLLKKSLKDGRLKTSVCDVFKPDELLYFFVGRPAYKKEAVSEGEYWELPSCILFDFEVSGAKRVFPFDTGAFHAKRYPSYINMMEMSDYEIDSSESEIKRAIGAFFGSSRDYYRLNPRSQEMFESLHDVGATDEEIHALHRLIKHRSKRSDDRRFSIEVQFAEAFEFTRRKPIFAVFPEIYLDSEIFMGWIKKYDVLLETYPYYPLRGDYYYSAIYEKIDKFYRENGYYEV